MLMQYLYNMLGKKKKICPFVSDIINVEIKKHGYSKVIVIPPKIVKKHNLNFGDELSIAIIK